MAAILKHGMGNLNPEASAIMAEKISKMDNPFFANTVYTTNIEDRMLQDKDNPKFAPEDLMRTAETFDNYNNISDAVKKLINELNLKSKK